MLEKILIIGQHALDGAATNRDPVSAIPGGPQDIRAIARLQQLHRLVGSIANYRRVVHVEIDDLGGVYIGGKFTHLIH